VETCLDSAYCLTTTNDTADQNWSMSHISEI